MTVGGLVVLAWIIEQFGIQDIESGLAQRFGGYVEDVGFDEYYLCTFVCQPADPLYKFWEVFPDEALAFGLGDFVRQRFFQRFYHVPAAGLESAQPEIFFGLQFGFGLVGCLGVQSFYGVYEQSVATADSVRPIKMPAAAHVSRWRLRFGDEQYFDTLRPVLMPD